MHVLIVLAALSALGGCADRGERQGPFEPIRLVPDAKAARDDRFLTWGGTLTIGGMERPVLSAATPIMPPVEVARGAESAQRVARGPLPAELSAVPWIIIESVTTRDGVTTPMASWPATSALAGKPFQIPIVDEMVGANGKASVVLWGVPDLATRDVETGDVAVPAHAVLTLGAALQPSCLQSTAIPIDMTVSARTDDRDVVLLVQRLQPGRDANRWVDAQVPLTGLSGRVARFRFTARPILGPTAVPTLPVWAEPTIVDARTLPR